MVAMKSLWFCAVAALAWGCGGSEGEGVKTPDQLIDEQVKIAEEDEKRKAAKGEDPALGAEETDAEKKREFDQKQVKMELSRATRSAESCPGVVAEMETKEHPRGEARVTVTFVEDGTVRDVSIPSPFDGTPIGDCVKRAYKSVIVPPSSGGEQIVDWDLTLKDEKGVKSDSKAKKKK
jgi:hypothetical protein